MAAMKGTYGPKRGESVFYASHNAGTIKGVDKTKPPKHKFKFTRPDKRRTK